MQRLLFFIFHFLLLFKSPAYSEQCLHPAQDPSEISHATKLRDMATYVDQAQEKYKKLLSRKNEITNRLAEIEVAKTKLLDQLSLDNSSYMQESLIISQKDMNKARLIAREIQIQKQNESDKRLQAELEILKKEKNDLNQMVDANNLAFETVHRRLTLKSDQIIQNYNTQVDLAKKTYQQKMDSIQKDFKNIPRAKNGSLLYIEKELQTAIQNAELKRDYEISKNDLEHEKLLERQAEAQRIIDHKTEDLIQREQTAQSRHTTDYEQYQEEFNTLGSVKKNLEKQRLARASRPIRSTIHNLNIEMNDLKKELQKILGGTAALNPNTPEKDLDKHGIKELEHYIGKHLGSDNLGNPIFSNDGEFDFIQRWWNEQGKRNRERAFSTEGSALPTCQNCSQISQKIDLSYGIKKECVLAGISTLTSDTNQFFCENSKQSRARTIKKACITDELADYMQWSINNALKCLTANGSRNIIDPNILAIKLNRESNFNPTYNYSGGTGMAQTTTCSRDEMLGCMPSPFCCKSDDSKCLRASSCSQRSSGRKFLSNLMSENNKALSKNSPQIPSACSSYKKIIDFDKESDSSLESSLRPKRLFRENDQFKCQSLSLEEGIHRNLLTGLGLYLFYRDGNANSAENLIKEKLNLSQTSPDYSKIKDYLALGMYGRNGQNGTAAIFDKLVPQMQSRMRNGHLSFEDFKDVLSGDNGIPYLKEIEESAQKSFITLGGGSPQCSLGSL